jgi:hypothetical protein
VTRPREQQVGAFLHHQAEELTRIWRLARHTGRKDVFPGCLDGIISDFFARVGAMLEAGLPPESVWSTLEGTVRWPPGIAPAELLGEWDGAREVLEAACESVNAAPGVKAWLEAALAAARTGTEQLDAGRSPARPENLVTLLVLGSYAPSPRRAR